MLNKIINYLLLVFVFLLPWQTRMIYDPARLNGSYFEYGSFTLYATEIILWTIILLAIINVFLQKKFLRKISDIGLLQKKIQQLFFGFFALVIFGILIWHSLNWQLSYQFVLRLLGAVCVFGIISKKPSVEKIKMMLVLWLSGVFQGVLAVIEFFTQRVPSSKWLGMAAQNARDLGTTVIEFGYERWLRAYGSFGSPNALGIYLAIILVLGLLLYLSLNNFKHKILLTVGQLVILSGLILSFSRNAWLACLAGLLFVFFSSKNRLEIGKQLGYYFLILIIFFIALKPIFLTRAQSQGRLEQKSISERQTQLREWKTIFTNNRIGVGPGVYTLALYKLNPNKPAWQYQPVHNVYLLMLGELGIVGTLLLLSILTIILQTILKNNQEFFSVVVVLLCSGLFDHWLWSMFSGLIVFSVLLALVFREKNNFNNNRSFYCHGGEANGEKATP